MCILCDAGGGNAARDLDGLRALAEVGDQDAAEQLATLMADQGRGEEAMNRLTSADVRAGSAHQLVNGLPRGCQNSSSMRR